MPAGMRNFLGEELQALLNIDLGFDVSITGFSVAETDILIEGLMLQEPGDSREDQLPTDLDRRGAKAAIFGSSERIAWHVGGFTR